MTKWYVIENNKEKLLYQDKYSIFQKYINLLYHIGNIRLVHIIDFIISKF